MGMDIDYVAARSAIGDLERLLSNVEHGEREEIADDIIGFVRSMKKKWGEKSTEEKTDDPSGTPISEELLKSKGFACIRERDKDNDKDGHWVKDGLTIYQDFWSGDEFNFATRVENGEFKAGYRVKDLQRLRELYKGIEGKELD